MKGCMSTTLKTFSRSALRKLAALPLIPVALMFHALPAKADLVQNGSFELNGGVGELTSGVSFATNWSVGATVDGAPYPFAFIADSNADSTGFPSIFSPPNIMLWGPNTPVGMSSPTTSYPSQHPTGPVANGFTASPDGGDFLGVDAAYADAPVSQDITGLIIGQQYTLSFYYAGAQFTDALGPNNEAWQVSFGTDTVTTPTLNNASQGFTGWQTFTQTFTAASGTQTLTFLAQGGPAGLPPFALLDGVSLTPVTPSSPTPEPTSLILGGSMLALLVAGKRRITRNR